MITGLPLHHHDMESRILCDVNGKTVIELRDDLDSELILTAVNMHEGLVDVLESVRESLLDIDRDATLDGCLMVIQDILAKAEGGK